MVIIVVFLLLVWVMSWLFNSSTTLNDYAVATEPTIIAGKTLPAATVDFARDVLPIFQRACFECHDAKLQKGKFRLDQREALLKGGGSGEIAVTPGDIQKSRLMYHLLLPRDHDDAMPPKGKDPLTPAEIVAVAQWIQAGAKFE